MKWQALFQCASVRHRAKWIEKLSLRFDFAFEVEYFIILQAFVNRICYCNIFTQQALKQGHPSASSFGQSYEIEFFKEKYL